MQLLKCRPNNILTPAAPREDSGAIQTRCASATCGRIFFSLVRPRTQLVLLLAACNIFLCHHPYVPENFRMVRPFPSRTVSGKRSTPRLFVHDLLHAILVVCPRAIFGGRSDELNSNEAFEWLTAPRPNQVREGESQQGLG